MVDSRKWGKPDVRRIDSTLEAIGISLQELSRAVEHRTLWTSVIHRASRSQSWLDSMQHQEARKGFTLLNDWQKNQKNILWHEKVAHPWWVLRKDKLAQFYHCKENSLGKKFGLATLCINSHEYVFSKSVRFVVDSSNIKNFQSTILIISLYFSAWHLVGPRYLTNKSANKWVNRWMMDG